MLSEKGSISVSLLPDLNKLLRSFNMLLIYFEIKYANGKKISQSGSHCSRNRCNFTLYLIIFPVQYRKLPSVINIYFVYTHHFDLFS